MPQHLTISAIDAFLNDKFCSLKMQFLTDFHKKKIYFAIFSINSTNFWLWAPFELKECVLMHHFYCA